MSNNQYGAADFAAQQKKTMDAEISACEALEAAGSAWTFVGGSDPIRRTVFVEKQDSNSGATLEETQIIIEGFELVSTGTLPAEEINIIKAKWETMQ